MERCDHEWIDLIFFSKEKYKTCKKCGVTWEDFLKQGEKKSDLIYSNETLVDEALRKLIISNYQVAEMFVDDLIYVASLHGREISALYLSPSVFFNFSVAICFYPGLSISSVIYRGIKVLTEPQFDNDQWDYKLKTDIVF